MFKNISFHTNWLHHNAEAKKKKKYMLHTFLYLHVKDECQALVRGASICREAAECLKKFITSSEHLAMFIFHPFHCTYN